MLLCMERDDTSILPKGITHVKSTGATATGQNEGLNICLTSRLITRVSVFCNELNDFYENEKDQSNNIERVQEIALLDFFDVFTVKAALTLHNLLKALKRQCRNPPCLFLTVFRLQNIFAI